jgi:hypothetical protein
MKLLNEDDEPRVKKSNTLIEEPTRMHPSSESDEPTLTKLLIETLLPRHAKSKTDSAEPK